jgi:hypothetical protein
MNICECTIKGKIDFYKLLLKITADNAKKCEEINRKIEDLKSCYDYLTKGTKMDFLPVESIDALLKKKGLMYKKPYCIDLVDEIDSCVQNIRNEFA